MGATNFATLYASMQDEQFYHDWFDLLKPYITEPKDILDLGCGNGTLLGLLHDAGHTVSGVDVSPDMLSLARERLGSGAQLYEDDMVRFFTGEEKYDIIVSTCDSLNYLSKIEDVAQVFASVHKMLKPGGLFCFDVHSDYTFTARFIDWHYGQVDENTGLIWDIEVYDEHMYEHNLTFFVRNVGGLYERYDMLQVEYFHPEATLLTLLDNEQFNATERRSDFAQTYTNEGDRTFFIVQK